MPAKSWHRGPREARAEGRARLVGRSPVGRPQAEPVHDLRALHGRLGGDEPRDRLVAAAELARCAIERRRARRLGNNRAQRILDAAEVVGPAFTLRFVPMREDISVDEAIEGFHSPRAAIARMPKDCIVVASAMGFRQAGLLGDIVCARMKFVGVAGFVTDGAMRDHSGLTKLGWPIWCDGISAPPSTIGLYCADTQVPVACGGVTIFPADIVVADEDGAVVIPHALADEVAAQAYEEELFESWVYDQVACGAPLNGLYPPDDETKRRYAASRER